MARKVTSALLIALSALIMLTIPVLAITNPTTVDITRTHATQNVLTTGDILFMAEYQVSYGTVPNETVDTAFIFQLVDTDGTTELGRVLAFPYVTSGYGRGIVSFYFAVAPGTEQYIIRIIGNPALFSPPYQSADFTMPASTYTVTSNITTTDIANQVRIYANDLEPTYRTPLGSSLLSSATATSITLSAVGEIYFTNSIPNLRNMSPELFDVEEYVPVATVDTYNTTQADAYETRFVGTWVANSTTAAASLLATDMQVAMGFIIVVICALWAFIATGVEGKVSGGYLPMVSTLLCGTVLGFASMAVTSVMVFIAALYIGMILIFKGVNA